MAKKQWPKLKTEIRRIDPKTLKRREVNARYMEPAQFQALVENFKTDGTMTGVVTTCWLDKAGGAVEILSGHHRAEAAIEAGLPEIDILHIDTPLDEERKTAIQLSHNAITGQDNPSVLKQLYDSLDLSAKKFSGLTDGAFGKLDKLDLSGLGGARIKYEELMLLFLPSELALFGQYLERFEKSTKQRPLFAARYEDFDQVFDAIVAVKTKLKVFNAAAALMTMAELALQKLEELEAQRAQDDDETDETQA